MIIHEPIWPQFCKLDKTIVNATDLTEFQNYDIDERSYNYHNKIYMKELQKILRDTTKIHKKELALDKSDTKWASV